VVVKKHEYEELEHKLLAKIIKKNQLLFLKLLPSLTATAIMTSTKLVYTIQVPLA
jgi:hypothetical protein